MAQSRGRNVSTLTRDAILGVQDLKTERVPVPEWGGDIYVRGMSGAERDAFEQSLMVGDKFTPDNVRARLAARCICDEKGERLFSDADIVVLGAKNAAALDRVYDVAQRLSGIGKKDLDAAIKN